MIYFTLAQVSSPTSVTQSGDRGDSHGAGVLPDIGWQMVCVLDHRSSPSEEMVPFKVSSTEEFKAGVVIPSLPGSNTFHYSVYCLWSEAFPGLYRGL